jgi:hypothetical protein
VILKTSRHLSDCQKASLHWVMNTDKHFKNELVRKLADFLNEIGIETVSRRLEGETFLPGVEIGEGRLLVDEARLLYPGDLLHEAGHLAVMPRSLRFRLSGNLLETDPNMDWVEVAAIAWSYAACLHLKIGPEIVFHPAGYKGKSQALLMGFSLGVYPGAHRLQTLGLCMTPKQAAESGAKPFPHMLKWLAD